MIYLLVFRVVFVVNSLSKSRVDGVRAFKEVRSLVTGNGVQREGADEVGLNTFKIFYISAPDAIGVCDLVEDGLVGADEAPFEHLLLAVRILDRVAHVEQLTVVGHVSVVTVGPALTGELVDDVLPDGVGVRHQAQLGGDGVLGGSVVLSLNIRI